MGWAAGAGNGFDPEHHLERERHRGVSGVLGDRHRAVRPAPVRQQAQGNPLAAGLVAFGAGLVVAALIPASEKEQQAAVAVKDKAQPLQQQVTDVAKDTAGNLKEPARQAVLAVKDTATDAASTVKDEGTSAAQDVQSQAQDAKDAEQDQQG